MARKIRLTVKRTITVRTRITQTIRTTPPRLYIGTPQQAALPQEELYCDTCGTLLDEQQRCPECNPIE